MNKFCSICQMTLNQLILDVIVFKEIWIVNKELSDFFHKGIVIHSSYSSFKRLHRVHRHARLIKFDIKNRRFGF